MSYRISAKFFQKLHLLEIQPNEEQTKELKKILEEVGFSVEENGYFEPFTRGYFTE